MTSGKHEQQEESGLFTLMLNEVIMVEKKKMSSHWQISQISMVSMIGERGSMKQRAGNCTNR